MTETLTSGTVIDSIWRTGDVGEPGYSVRGQILPKCTYSGSQDDWSGATQGNLNDLLPTCYITESVYSFLTDAEIESVRGRIRGIVQNDYAYKYYKGDRVYCWAFKPEVSVRDLPSLDPCEGVVCDPMCVGLDSYAMICEEGACVQGDILKANDPDCGYIPTDEPSIFDLISDNKEILIIGVIVGALALKSI